VTCGGKHSSSSWAWRSYASACGKDNKKSKQQVVEGGHRGGGDKNSHVDGQTDKFNSAFLAYFPNEVQVRPGDTVDFKEIWTGEPHSVTMGTLVEAGLSAAKAAPPNGPPGPGFASLPVMLPEGPGDANQTAAQPCFLDSEKPPTDATKGVPQGAAAAFNGRQSYYNSGFLPEGKTFSVKLADDVSPGAYHYYCNLHGADMSGRSRSNPRNRDPVGGRGENAGKSQLAARQQDRRAPHRRNGRQGASGGRNGARGFGADSDQRDS